MTPQQFNSDYKGKRFMALRNTAFKYTYQLGGGIRSDARTVMKDDVVTVVDFAWNIDTVAIGTLECLNRIEKDCFDKTFIEYAEATTLPAP